MSYYIKNYKSKHKHKEKHLQKISKLNNLFYGKRRHFIKIGFQILE